MGRQMTRWGVIVAILLLAAFARPTRSVITPVRSARPFTRATVRVTHYWPPNLGMNCYLTDGEWCISPTASGLPWEVAAGVGHSAACPPEWPLFSLVYLEENGETLICLDRGGAIQCEEGKCVVDILRWDDALDGEYSAQVYAPFWRIYGYSDER